MPWLIPASLLLGDRLDREKEKLRDQLAEERHKRLAAARLAQAHYEQGRTLAAEIEDSVLREVRLDKQLDRLSRRKID